MKSSTCIRKKKRFVTSSTVVHTRITLVFVVMDDWQQTASWVTSRKRKMQNGSVICAPSQFFQPELHYKISNSLCLNALSSMYFHFISIFHYYCFLKNWKSNEQFLSSSHFCTSDIVQYFVTISYNKYCRYLVISLLSLKFHIGANLLDHDLGLEKCCVVICPRWSWCIDQEISYTTCTCISTEWKHWM